MKNEILNNWEAKIVALLLAFTLWFLVKKNIGPVLVPNTIPFDRYNVQIR